MTEHTREHNQKIARHLRKGRGVELTPDQVAEIRRSAHDAIRTHLRSLGYFVPDGEAEMTAFMQMVWEESK